jgi:cation diffusion facilitator family transporter
MHPTLKREKTILNISLIGSLLFLIAEIVMSIITNSNAVFMDCVYDIADIIMIGPFIVLIPLLYKQETEKRPYGFSQVESLFIMIKSGLLIGVTLFLIYDSGKTLFSGGNDVDATSIAIFETVVSLTCVIMYLVLSKLSKKTKSPSIEAELYIWKLDALSTIGVGIAFFVKLLLENTTYAYIGPYIDPMIAIILALVLLKEPLSLFVESIKNLILFAPDTETSTKIRDICADKLDDYHCYINFLDVIKTGRKLWIEVYFVTDKDDININNIRKARKEIKEELLKEFDNLYVELIPDIDEVSGTILDKVNTRRPDKITHLKKKEQNKIRKKSLS